MSEPKPPTITLGHTLSDALAALQVAHCAPPGSADAHRALVSAGLALGAACSILGVHLGENPSMIGVVVSDDLKPTEH